MYGWMPVGHNWQKCKLKSNKCPCCGEPDKTFEHLIGCKNKKMVQARKEAYVLIQNKYIQLKLPFHFTTTIIETLKVILERTEPSPTTEADLLQEAIAAQATIGYYNMAIGFADKV